MKEFFLYWDGIPRSSTKSCRQQQLGDGRVMNAETAMVDYYARRAKEYERIYQKPERQADLTRLRDFLEGAFVGLDVLEIACGTGYWTAVIARTAASVLATDINDEVLAMARTKSTTQATVTFQRADAYALPDFPRKFPAGLAAFWWSHVPKASRSAFLQGFHRRLLPGARVIMIDNIYVEGSSSAVIRTDADGNTYQLRQLEDGSSHEVIKKFPEINRAAGRRGRFG